MGALYRSENDNRAQKPILVLLYTRRCHFFVLASGKRPDVLIRNQ